jgi:hypothetical protein
MLNSFRAVIQDGKIELTQPVELPEGTRVVVTLVPEVGEVSAEPKPPRKLGTLEGSVSNLAPDFDAPLDDFQDYTA